MSEDWFWKTEPKKVIAMLDEKRNIDKEKSKLNAYYVACMMVGKNPDEEDNGTAGIDYPVTEDMLKGFF